VELSCFSTITSWLPWKLMSYSNTCIANLITTCDTTNYETGYTYTPSLIITILILSYLYILFHDSHTLVMRKIYSFFRFTCSSAIFTLPL
jgi:hypothetical protein